MMMLLDQCRLESARVATLSMERPTGRTERPVSHLWLALGVALNGSYFGLLNTGTRQIQVSKSCTRQSLYSWFVYPGDLRGTGHS